ncbi:MAG: GNAT family N-acetyltransferase [Candidatus Delongbacteria bacterium]|nr:GNAT family N-acetyltransferase [Candidatus Delongbacteria bacterium]
MSKIKIVEYKKDYAAGVATMWNCSTDGWNGADFSTTEKKVLLKESMSPHVNLFLAVDEAVKSDEPKVVGYCKLSKDSKDENALYIALLSVIPEYFNKKVGKALVLESVKRTIELSYPRLYLHTWSGNTRAVPLYKKTGFFWEQGQEIHLINHIPFVLNCDAVKDYFKKVDWYNDSKRKIDITPDGRKDNKFEYYTYSWEKNKKKLVLEFDKCGKGLRKIDCDDYTITATVCNRDLSFGKKHKISYEFINKCSKPLKIEMKGISNEGIEFKYNFKTEVKKTLKTDAEFFVNPITVEQDRRGTHPKICTNIKINGKLAAFKSGIVPKFPLYVNLLNKAEFNYSGQKEEMYLNCESFLDEKARFEFDLSYGDGIIFENPKVSFELKANEKISIPVKTIINKGYLYSKKFDITAILQNGKKIKFNETVVARAYTHKSMGFNETEHRYESNIGKFALNILKKRQNCFTYFLDHEVNGQEIFFPTPKLGLPYTDEFDHREVDRVEYTEEKNSSVMKGIYTSENIKDLEFAICYRLFPNGIIEKWMEFSNTGKKKLGKDIIYCDRFVINRENMVLPYKNKFVKIQTGVDHNLNKFDSKHFTENWIYSGDKKKSAGITWPEEYELKLVEWYFAIEYSLEGLKPGKSMITKPITFFLNTFDLKNFRNFVQKNSKLKEVSISRSAELTLNGQNPFIRKNIKVELKEARIIPLNAELSISSSTKAFKKQHFSLKEGSNLSGLSAKIEIRSDKDIELVNCNIRQKAHESNVVKALFPMRNRIKLTETTEESKKVYSVDNGTLCFKTSPDFAPNIFSLKHNGIEWVDSSFPQTCSKSWWTPWYGGLFMNIGGFSEKELLEEKLSAEFVKIEDNLNNKWKGVKIIVKVVKNEEYKGLTIEQYHLTLPGTPVVLNFNKIINRSKKYFNSSYYKLSFFNRGEKNIRDHYWRYFNNNDDICKLYHGYENLNISVDHDKVTSLNCDGIDNKILFFHPNKIEYIAACANEAVIPKVSAEEFNVKNGSSFVTSYEFMIFTDMDINYKELEDLKNIRFEV